MKEPKSTPVWICPAKASTIVCSIAYCTPPRSKTYSMGAGAPRSSGEYAFVWGAPQRRSRARATASQTFRSLSIGLPDNQRPPPPGQWRARIFLHAAGDDMERSVRKRPL